MTARRTDRRPGAGPLVATIAVVLAATGCGGEPDPFRIRFRLSQGPAYSCPASSCDGVAMTCDAVAVIRIVDPADPGRAFVSECIEIDNPEDVCDLGRADLPAGLMVPDQELEVQIALFPRTALIGASGEVECPSVLDFGLADGFPVNVAPAPALGGRTYVHAEDGEAVVELGCGDTELLAGAACRDDRRVEVSASVDDFDSGVFVAPAVAGLLTVRVGEPTARTNPMTEQIEWTLDPGSTAALPLRELAPVPSWSDVVELALGEIACVQVLEEAPQAASAVACSRVAAGAARLDLRGIRLARGTLAQVLAVLGEPTFPERGLVVGVVLDYLGNPSAGAVLTPSDGSVAYLAPDRLSLGGGATTSSGIFVSQDVPFDATWAVQSPVPVEALPVGGLIVGKVTVLVVTLRQVSM